MSSTTSPAKLADYVRTWSSYHGWMEANPDRKPRDKEGGSGEGEGDIVDVMMDEILAVEDSWREPGAEILMEWGSGLLLARAADLRG